MLLKIDVKKTCGYKIAFCSLVYSTYLTYKHIHTHIYCFYFVFFLPFLYTVYGMQFRATLLFVFSLCVPSAAKCTNLWWYTILNEPKIEGTKDTEREREKERDGTLSFVAYHWKIGIHVFDWKFWLFELLYYVHRISDTCILTANTYIARFIRAIRIRNCCISFLCFEWTSKSNYTSMWYISFHFFELELFILNFNLAWTMAHNLCLYYAAIDNNKKQFIWIDTKPKQSERVKRLGCIRFHCFLIKLRKFVIFFRKTFSSEPLF